MNRFANIFRNKCSIIGMIHVDALPGTPKYAGSLQAIIDKAKHEANIYQKSKIDAILVENMHDVPYMQNDQLGPEITASMTALAIEVKRVFRKRPIGLQILALGNCQALAAAQAANCQFIRNEGFVFAHVADEGITNSNAGQVLRYRRQIGAENVLVLTDIKKKHSAHSITNDVSLLETAHAAEFFCTDGVILTGTATGCAASKQELLELHGKIQTPILIGSGVTVENVSDYFHKSHAIIVGSHFKSNGQWRGDLSPDRIDQFMERTLALREKAKNYH